MHSLLHISGYPRFFQGPSFSTFISRESPSSIIFRSSVSISFPILTCLCSSIKRTFHTLKSMPAMTWKMYKCVRLYSDENSSFFSPRQVCPLKTFSPAFPMTQPRKPMHSFVPLWDFYSLLVDTNQNSHHDVGTLNEEEKNTE